MFICSYSQSVGAMHFETSAKNNVGVEDLFLSLTNMVCAFFGILSFFINFQSRTSEVNGLKAVTLADGINKLLVPL